MITPEFFSGVSAKLKLIFKHSVFAALPLELAEYSEQIFALIDDVFSEPQLTKPENELKTDAGFCRTIIFRKKNFRNSRTNQKAAYTAHFDSQIVK